ncbi:TPA: hypothetical protein EYP66_23715 [Candidatus Poribacteria bacterium]|nr:hypothetical protein [Candidatus Poribacteria bacterium]
MVKRQRNYLTPNHPVTISTIINTGVTNTPAPRAINLPIQPARAPIIIGITHRSYPGHLELTPILVFQTKIYVVYFLISVVYQRLFFY